MSIFALTLAHAHMRILLHVSAGASFTNTYGRMAKAIGSPQLSSLSYHVNQVDRHLT